MKELVNKKLINDIERIFEINLFSYEKKFIDALIEARKNDKRVIIRSARMNRASFSRALLIYSLYEESKLLEEKILYGNQNEKPKGLIETKK